MTEVSRYRSRSRIDWSILYEVRKEAPVRGYRAWVVDDDNTLSGIYRRTAWTPGAVETSTCDIRHKKPLPHYCHCGIWALSRLRDVVKTFRLETDARFPLLLDKTDLPVVVGRVKLWGYVRVRYVGEERWFQASHGEIDALSRAVLPPMIRRRAAGSATEVLNRVRMRYGLLS